MSNSSISVVIGRFQVDALTTGHIGLLREAKEYGKLIIFVGNRPTPANATNPLPFFTVEAMLREEHPDAIILPIGDEQSSERWSKKLDQMIGMIAGPLPVTIFTGRDGFNKHYTGRYQVVDIDLDDSANATAIRTDIGEQIEVSRTWRRGVIWAHQNRQHQDYYAVDMACLRLTLDKRVELLLARKPDESQWRFPGGFVEPGETFRQAAGREFREETGLVTADGFEIIKDFVIPDWRTKTQQGVGTKTVLTVGWYFSGLATAQDDIAEVKWVDIMAVVKDVKTLVPIHRELFTALFEYLNVKGIPCVVLTENAVVRKAMENLENALKS